MNKKYSVEVVYHDNWCFIKLPKIIEDDLRRRKGDQWVDQFVDRDPEDLLPREKWERADADLVAVVKAHPEEAKVASLKVERLESNIPFSWDISCHDGWENVFIEEPQGVPCPLPPGYFASDED